MANLNRQSSGDPLRKDFRNFVHKTWRYLGLPDPTPIQYDFAHRLQHGPDRDVLMGFRGMAKSYITVTFGVWALYCNQEEIVLTVSATSKMAAQNAFFAFSMLSGFDWLSHLIPRTDQRRSSLAFDVAGATPKKSESFCSESLFGQITGRRATLIIPDDVEIPQTSDTEGNRMLLRSRYAELGGAILLPGGKIKVLGTAQCEQSLYPELVHEKGYGIRMWPIRYPTPESFPKFGSWLAPKLAKDLEENPSLAGTSTEPTRFGEPEIAEKRLEYGKTEFERQFLLWLDAGQGVSNRLKMRDFMVLEWAPPKEGTPLKLPPEVQWGPDPSRKIEDKDIPIDALGGDALYSPRYVSSPDEWRPANYVRMYVDPAAGGGDETTWTIQAVLNALAFDCHHGASLDGYSDAVLQSIAADAKLWGVQYIKVESNFGQGMFGALLRPKLQAIHHDAIIEEDRKGNVQKEVRIISNTEPALTGHRLVLNAAMLRKDFPIGYDSVEDAKKRFYRFTYQLTRITKDKGCLAHDDRLDSYASSLEEFLDLLKQQTETARKADKEQAMQEEIQHMLDVRAKQGLPLLDAYGQPVRNNNRSRFGLARLANKSKMFHPRG